MASPSVAAVAVISADNTPRFIETYTDGNSDAVLALHSACYSALDVVDERVAAARVRGSGSAAAIADCYLGELLPLEEHVVHGYLTPTWVKIMLVVGDEVPLQPADARRILGELHTAYARAAAAAPLGGDAFAPKGAFARAAREAVALAPRRA